MDDMTVVLKAVADQTRLKIVNMLLRRNYCESIGQASWTDRISRFPAFKSITGCRIDCWRETRILHAL